MYFSTLQSFLHLVFLDEDYRKYEPLCSTFLKITYKVFEKQHVLTHIVVFTTSITPHVTYARGFHVFSAGGYYYTNLTRYNTGWCMTFLQEYLTHLRPLQYYHTLYKTYVYISRGPSRDSVFINFLQQCMYSCVLSLTNISHIPRIL